MSSMWSVYIVVIVAVNILGCAALLFFTRKKKSSGENGQTTGHIYDGIEEYDNPLPRWWLFLFYITIIFSIIYLILYPGLGNYKGLLGWNQIAQYDNEIKQSDDKYLPLFKHYAGQSIEQLQSQPDALQMGQSIFTNVCFGCHGADGRGALGFPNLADNDWLYGGDPEQIKKSILQGRAGIMPAWQASLGIDGVDEVVHYVLSKNKVKRQFDKEKANAGAQHYQQFCVACHAADLQGNQALGAPNLIDGIWLHGGSISLIKDIVANGVKGNMPPHANILGNDKSHLVAAYVYSLSPNKKPTLASTSVDGQLTDEHTVVQQPETNDPLSKFATMSIDDMQSEAEALAAGEQTFKQVCAACHGQDGKGGVVPGSPNLTDNDWLYGSDADQILHSVVNGRNGVMPGWESSLGASGVEAVVDYVLSNNQQQRQFKTELLTAGKKHYQQYCVACHGQDLTGNQALGAPNLTDDIWLHGEKTEKIRTIVAKGIQGNMPAHGPIIGELKARLVSAYVYSLRQDK